jgi:DNA modification methylase
MAGIIWWAFKLAIYLVAAKLEGYPAVGIELSHHYAKAAKERLEAEESESAEV